MPVDLVNVEVGKDEDVAVGSDKDESLVAEGGKAKAGKVKVVIINQQKEVKIPTGLRMVIRRSCVAVIKIERFGRPVTVTVAFVDNEGIRKLNKKFRNKDAETDVLSFPALDADGNYTVDSKTGLTFLGDIAISMEKALAQAKEHNNSLQEEVSFLVVHSMLHLLGYDHESSEEDSLRMKERETLIMANLGYVSVPGHKSGI